MGQLVLITLIVLKLTGVIAWSWLWVLSPMWIGGIVLVLGVCALLLWARWRARRQARVWIDQLGTQWFRQFMAGNENPDASGGDLGLPDGGQGTGQS
jgi:hypothetical protein